MVNALWTADECNVNERWALSEWWAQANGEYKMHKWTMNAYGKLGE